MKTAAEQAAEDTYWLRLRAPGRKPTVYGLWTDGGAKGLEGAKKEARAEAGILKRFHGSAVVEVFADDPRKRRRAKPLATVRRGVRS
jgi:hypothetical protein